MAFVIFGVIAVLGFIIGLLNWFGVTPRQVSWIAKKFGRNYIEFGSRKRHWLVYDITMSAYLWATFGYFLSLHIQDLESNGDGHICTLILAGCSITLYTSFVLYRYFKGYYKG